MSLGVERPEKWASVSPPAPVADAEIGDHHGSIFSHAP